jgi:hypothetical protein
VYEHEPQPQARTESARQLGRTPAVGAFGHPADNGPSRHRSSSGPFVFTISSA